MKKEISDGNCGRKKQAEKEEGKAVAQVKILAGKDIAGQRAHQKRQQGTRDGDKDGIAIGLDNPLRVLENDPVGLQGERLGNQAEAMADDGFLAGKEGNHNHIEGQHTNQTE